MEDVYSVCNVNDPSFKWRCTNIVKFVALGKQLQFKRSLLFADNTPLVTQLGHGENSIICLSSRTDSPADERGHYLVSGHAEPARNR